MSYPLSNEEWLKICKTLTHSEICVFLYIKTLDKAEGLHSIANSLNLPAIAVHRAINRLIKLGSLSANEVGV